MNLITLIITEDRIGSFVATQVEIVNLDRLTFCFLHVHRDFTLDGTAQVITTEHITEVTVSNIQGYITIYVRLVGTRKQLINLFVRLTAQGHIHIAVDIGILTGTYNLLHCQLTTIRVFRVSRISYLINGPLNDTLLVTTTISLVNQSALHQCICIARTVGRCAMVKRTDIGT